jgi:hypothetical protein
MQWDLRDGNWSHHGPVAVRGRGFVHEGVERGLRDRTAWEPPFLRPRSSWTEPGSHPLAWYGIPVPPLRTLALLRGTDPADPGASLPDTPAVELPTTRQ